MTRPTSSASPARSRPAYKRLDPAHASYYDARLRTFETASLSRYHALIAAIRRRYAGVPVGASESIFALQAPALGLRLITPASFMRAVSEGTEVTAQDTATAEQQITGHAIKVWIFNTQNATPEIERLNGLARAAGIPIATVTETLSPADDTFEQWQCHQLAGHRGCAAPRDRPMSVARTRSVSSVRRPESPSSSTAPRSGSAGAAFSTTSR